MKSLTLLLLVMMAAGVGGQSVVFSHRGAAAGAPRETLGVGRGYESGTEYPINILDGKNHRNEKNMHASGPINELEAKQLKLIFLLLLSIGPLRSPVH